VEVQAFVASERRKATMAKTNKASTSKAHRSKVGRPEGARNVRRERPADPRYLSIRDFCERFDCSPATAYRHLPRMKVLKLGRRTLISAEEVDRYASTLMREPAST
jgi:hypothetical protein